MTRGQYTLLNVAIGTTAAASTAINFQDHNAGVITINTAAISDVDLSPYVSHKIDGDYTPLYLADDSAEASITVSSARSYALPAEAGLANFLKLVGSAAIADTTITLKCV